MAATSLSLHSNPLRRAGTRATWKTPARVLLLQVPAERFGAAGAQRVPGRPTSSLGPNAAAEAGPWTDVVPAITSPSGRVAQTHVALKLSRGRRLPGHDWVAPLHCEHERFPSPFPSTDPPSLRRKGMDFFLHFAPPQNATSLANLPRGHARKAPARLRVTRHPSAPRAGCPAACAAGLDEGSLVVWFVFRVPSTAPKKPRVPSTAPHKKLEGNDVEGWRWGP